MLPSSPKKVMHVYFLKKNLVSVTVIKDKGGYGVMFRGKTYLRHVATRKVKQIGVIFKNIYKLEVDFHACNYTSRSEVGRCRVLFLELQRFGQGP